MFIANNMAMLQKWHPEIYKKVSSCSQWRDDVVTHGEYYDSTQGGVWLYGGGFSIKWSNVIEQVNSAYPKLVAVYGFGLGNHIQELFQNVNLQKSEHILIIEKDLSLFKKALELRDYSKILSDKRLTLLIGYSLDEFRPEIQHYFQNYNRLFLIKTLTVIVDPVQLTEHQNYYMAVASLVQKAVHEANTLYLGSDEDSYRGYMNIIQNIPNFSKAHSFDEFVGKFEGKIGIAVSTGPSLKHSLAWIKSVQDHAVICCSDSSLKVMLDYGIEPHFVGCLERVPETNLLFDDLPQNLKTGLICSPVIWPETIKKYPGPLVNMLRPIGQMAWFYDAQKPYFTGNSVSHLLYVALNLMGCSEILIVGQDLAFDRFSEKTHVEGVHKLLHDVGQKQRFGNAKADERFVPATDYTSEVTGNNGQPIQTMGWYIQFKQQLEFLIRDYEYKGVNVIPIDYGAKINGIPIVDPSQVLEQFHFSDSDTWESISKIYSLENAKKDRIGYRERMSYKLEVAEDNLTLIHKTALNVLDALTLFRQRYNPNYYPESHYTELFKKVEYIANNMMERDKTFYDYFFYAQVISKSAVLLQLQGQILADKLPESQRVEGRYLLSIEWFDMLQKWSGRMANFINQYKDNLWPSKDCIEQFSSDEVVR